MVRARGEREQGGAVERAAMRCLRILLLLLWLSSAAWAHEFWLEPERFEVGGEPCRVSIVVGERFVGEPWKGALENITELVAVTGAGKTSLLKQPLTEPSFRLSGEQKGQHLVGFTNKNSAIELPADKFESYLRSEGLETIIEARANQGQSAAPGREHYRRCAKVLLHNGRGETAYGSVLGFPLELTALVDPYASIARPEMTFRATYDAKPLAGALIKVRHRFLGEVNNLELRTDEQGEVSFPYMARGDWLVTTVHMVPAKSEEADWQSFWGSYRFGF